MIELEERLLKAEAEVLKLRTALQDLYDEFTQTWCYPSYPSCKHRFCEAKRKAFNQAQKVLEEKR